MSAAVDQARFDDLIEALTMAQALMAQHETTLEGLLDEPADSLPPDSALCGYSREERMRIRDAVWPVLEDAKRLLGDFRRAREITRAIVRDRRVAADA